MASIKCGNCGQRHESVEQVRGCYGARDEPAKPGSVSFAQKLYRERDPSNTCLEGLTRAEAEETINSATKSGISQIIEQLELAPARKQQEPLSDGYWRTKNGTIWKLYYTQNGNLCAKELEVWQDDDRGELKWYHEWTYRGAARRFCAGAEKLTLEQAKEFGSIYGFCCVCGRTLTNELSIELGIGPVCGGRLA